MSTVPLSDGRANHESFAPRRHRTTLSNIPAAHSGGYSNPGEPHKLVGLQSITTRTASQSERTFSKVKAQNGKSHGISGFRHPELQKSGLPRQMCEAIPEGDWPFSFPRPSSLLTIRTHLSSCQETLRPIRDSPGSTPSRIDADALPTVVRKVARVSKPLRLRVAASLPPASLRES